MIGRIARHELRRNLRDGRSRALWGVTAIILLASMVLSLRDHQLATSQYEDNLKRVRYNWDSQTEKDPHDAAHDGTYVIKPLYPLAMFDNGIQPFTGKVVHLGAHQRKQGSLNEAKDRSGMFRFGQLTLSFILTYIFPLLIIFLGYNTFTEEKEKQTLRLLLVQGVPLYRLAIGKWLALLIQILLLWVPTLIVAVIFCAALGSNHTVSSYEWFVFSASYLLYFIAFINLTVWASVRSRSSGRSLTTLLAIWIMMALVVPKISTNVAGWFFPFPTLQTFRNNINEDQANGLNGHNFWNEAAQDFQQQVLKEYGVESIEDLPIAYGGLLLAEGEKYESEIYTKHFDLLRAQYEKQRSIYRWCGVLSPLLPMRFASMALARTDYGFLWHFEDQAEKYRIEFNTALNMNIAENAKGVAQYKAGKELWASLPSFNYDWRPASHIVKDQWVEVVTLVLWTVLGFASTVAVSNKLKVS